MGSLYVEINLQTSNPGITLFFLKKNKYSVYFDNISLEEPVLKKS